MLIIVNKNVVVLCHVTLRLCYVLVSRVKVLLVIFFAATGRLFRGISLVSVNFDSWLVHRFGDTVLTNGWSGYSIPSGSFTSNTYLWIRFISNVGNSDTRFHEGWTGTYQRYWPYVSG